MGTRAFRRAMLVAALVSLTPALGHAQSAFSGLQAPQTPLINPRTGQHAFISGINIGYLEEHYAFDLGPNLAGVRGRDQYFNSGTYSSESPGTYAALAGSPGGINGNVTRIFVFAGAQGLTFDGDGNVTGIDETFYQNLKDELTQVTNNGMSAILVLLTPNDDFGINISVDGSGSPLFGGSSATPIFVNGTATGATVKDFYNDDYGRGQLISNAFGALASRLHNDGLDQAVFAYEIINEYNQAVDQGRFWNGNALQSLIDDSRTAIHNAGYGGYITASTVNYYNWNGSQISNLRAGSIDFLDLHIYNTDGSVPTLDPSGPPVIIGEANCQDKYNCDDNTETNLLQTIATNAVNGGYAGFLPWWLGSSQQNGDGHSFIVRDGSPASSLNLRPAYYRLQDFNNYLRSTYGDL